MRSVPLRFLAVAPAVLLVGAVWPHPVSEIASLVAVASYPVALMALGASRGGRLGPLRWPLLLLLLLLVSGMLAMRALHAGVAGGARVGGLPLALAIQLFGIGLLPLPLVCFFFARSFDGHWLRGEDLEALERRFGRDRPPES